MENIPLRLSKRRIKSYLTQNLQSFNEKVKLPKWSGMGN